MSTGRRNGAALDYYPASGASEGEDSGLDDNEEATSRPADPASMGYLRLTCLNSDDSEGEVEFAEHVEQRRTSTYNLALGDDHDEEHEVISSSEDEGQPREDVEMEIDHNYDDDDEEDDGAGKISSGSGCKYYHYLVFMGILIVRISWSCC